MDNYLKVETLELLNKLPNHEEGELALVTNEETVYQYHNGEWTKVQINANDQAFNISLYDINKEIIGQLKPIEISNREIQIFQDLHGKYMNIHYMLLCHDFNYFTLFESDPIVSIPTFGAAVADILSSLNAKIYSVELTKNKDAVEIWAQLENKEEPYVFYLFPYDEGVVYYG